MASWVLVYLGLQEINQELNLVLLGAMSWTLASELLVKVWRCLVSLRLLEGVSLSHHVVHHVAEEIVVLLVEHILSVEVVEDLR